MNRDEMIARIEAEPTGWDFIIIGGGATGVGTAIDAASRGHRTCLLEQSDFGKGTSSRSTKLVHGGVRYLQQGNLSLVLEALKERGLLRNNAPHLVHHLPFIVPNYDWWEAPFYGIGLKVYDMLAGRQGFGHSKLLSKGKVLERIPTIETKGLKGGVVYYDGQFDDARLVINMAETAVEQGATLANYVKVERLVKDGDMVTGVVARDCETGQEHELRAKVVINATGVYADSVRKLDDTNARPMIAPSQGIHIVLDRSFLPGDSAIMVPQTDDGRVLFAIPWHDRVVVGTTDTPIKEILLEPKPLEQELSFLITHAARYLEKDPTESDVLSTFAGLRPLVSAGDEKNTAAISRDHTIHISRTGLLTITGGKWTTYRKMAVDTVDQAAVLAGFDARPSVTAELPIHGAHNETHRYGDLACYGSDAPAVQAVCDERSEFTRPIHAELPYRRGEVAWATRHEMARTVEDVLSRRTRALLLNAAASAEAAAEVAKIMAEELGQDATWQADQAKAYRELAERYQL